MAPCIRSLVLSLLALALLGGCSRTHALRSGTPDGRAALNEAGARRTALVTLVSGDEVEAASLHVAQDVATWIDPATQRGRSAPTSEIVRVRFTNHSRGALEGAGLGVALAAVLAGVSYATYGENDEWFTRRDAALVAGIGTGVPASALGALIGAGRGSRTVFEADSLRLGAQPR